MVAGTGRFTTDLMRTFGGSSLVAKEGAEGVYAVGVPAAPRAAGKALGIAVKIADGAERGRDAVTVETLRALGLARGARLGRLRRLAFRPVLNVRGDVVGGLETLFFAGAGLTCASCGSERRPRARSSSSTRPCSSPSRCSSRAGRGLRTNLAPFEDIARILVRAGHGGVLSNAFVYAVVGIVGNLAMFALWAFLLWKFLDGPGRSAARNHVDVILVGILFSLGIESVQLFLPTRAADINDVFWNVLGTIAGSALRPRPPRRALEWE